jgi:hypothetical protein
VQTRHSDWRVCGSEIADGRLSIDDCVAIDPPIRMAGQSATEDRKAADPKDRSENGKAADPPIRMAGLRYEDR